MVRHLDLNHAPVCFLRVKYIHLVSLDAAKASDTAAFPSTDAVSSFKFQVSSFKFQVSSFKFQVSLSPLYLYLAVSVPRRVLLYKML